MPLIGLDVAQPARGDRADAIFNEHRERLAFTHAGDHDAALVGGMEPLLAVHEADGLAQSRLDGRRKLQPFEHFPFDRVDDVGVGLDDVHAVLRPSPSMSSYCFAQIS